MVHPGSRFQWVLVMVGVTLGFLTSGCLARAEEMAGPEISQELDLRYAEGSDRNLLDVFRPVKGTGLPVVLFVHGGSWTIGDKNLFGLYRSVGQFLARHGMIAVMINYRLSPQVKHPEHIKDIARAYAWVRNNIARRGGDPDRIYLAGHSAGAHLVSLLATDEQFLKNPELKLEERDRSAIRGVISICGVYRIPGRQEYREIADQMIEVVLYIAAQNPSPASQLVTTLVRSNKNFDLLQMVFGSDDQVRDEASPLRHVRRGLPPFLILYAEYEIPRLEPMAREFRDALVKAGVPVKFGSISGHSHNTIAFRMNRPNDPTARAILDFLSFVEKERKVP